MKRKSPPCPLLSCNDVQCTTHYWYKRLKGRKWWIPLHSPWTPLTKTFWHIGKILYWCVNRKMRRAGTIWDSRKIKGRWAIWKRLDRRIGNDVNTTPEALNAWFVISAVATRLRLLQCRYFASYFSLRMLVFPLARGSHSIYLPTYPPMCSLHSIVQPRRAEVRVSVCVFCALLTVYLFSAQRRSGTETGPVSPLRGFISKSILPYSRELKLWSWHNILTEAM